MTEARRWTGLDADAPRAVTPTADIASSTAERATARFAASTLAAATVADVVWTAILEKHSPHVPSSATGQVVMVHGGGKSGPTLFVQAWESRVLGFLGAVDVIAFPVLPWMFMPTRPRQRS